MSNYEVLVKDGPSEAALAHATEKHAPVISGAEEGVLETRLVLLRHKLQRMRPFKLRRERCFDFAPQHGQRDRMAASLTVRRRRMVAIEFGTWRSGRSGGASGSITFGKGKFREENFGN